MITLKPFTEEDFDTLINWIDSPEFLMQWAGPHFSYPLTYVQLEEYLSGANESGSTTLIYTVWEKERRVGHISLGRIDRENNSARIGKVLLGDSNAKGRGICVSMIREALRIAFEELELHRVSLGVFDFNTSAINCYKKAGFQVEGLLRDYRKIEKKYWSLYEMSILAEEWAGG
ncbi:GNAT family N-acetyltransferase [Salimicrobium flavidum]|uniref:Protein N-acetyltransferase, RimJ/RimL family n=1 Tax=Salimicrobium flavidum TaxID=570947 RepID=A0A1N7J789_9BACI|nr:GNAT family protein [Salimicrobium flavidum]SIS45223.1 Protein N-acetyltransferase, RimJ/RimL family [Salimicrobium flavidum]